MRYVWIKKEYWYTESENMYTEHTSTYTCRIAHTTSLFIFLYLSHQNKPKLDPEALDLELFGLWQTEVYIPPPAVDVCVNKCLLLVQWYL